MTKSEPELKSGEVVIVGLSPLSGVECSPGPEMWGINQLPDYEHKPADSLGAVRPSRWFHLHGNDHIYRACPPGELGRMERLAKSIPVYMLADGQVPGARAFPFNDVQRFVYGVTRADFNEHPQPVYDNTFPWLIAFAVYLGARHIYLDGIDYRRSDEAWAVPSISWMLGFAWGYGVAVHVPPGCGLMGNSENLYGLNGPGCI